MGLSYDLISEFVKITNDKKEGPKEGTVYATVVNSTGGKYVKIDGSDLLTPIDTTTGIEDGERVTVMIKDHKATVTGNITSPSVGKGTVNSLVGAVVDENLVGINADIENLIAKNAYLENVFAENSVLIDSKIENLVAKDTYLENTYAENATIIDSKIENLEATDSRIENSVIENFQVIDGVVQDLKATNADIKVLNADFAQIKTLVNGNLTSDNILSFNLTSEKVTVDDAFIKDAMIDTISAGKINAGKINTNSVSIGSEDGGMLITGSTQQFMDKNGNVRIQIGKDASGDFTFILYGENGQGQIINQNGITASAIGDGLIVNNMVSDNAAISGGKLDISSVITEINSDNSTTIKSSKIYLNEQAQSLEVAFNSLKTKVDTFQEVTIQGDLTAIVEQVQSNTSKIEANKNSISTLISEDTVIKKQVTDLQGTVAKNEETLSAKYTTLTQNLEGFKTTVADTYATKSSVTDVVDNISANYSTTSVMNSAIEQKAQEISASVSSTYATKNQVNTLDNTLRQDYSTTQQMESAINVAKQEINLGVSSIYETKENSTSKIQNAVNNIQVGGTNLWVLLDLKSGYESSGNITSSGIQHKTRNTIIPTNGAKHLVYQCWNPNKVSNSSNTNRVAFFDSSKAYISSTQVLVLNGQTYQWQIINIPENTAYVRLGAICGPTDVYDTTIKIKFEFGNKPTDYSLAPEDVTNDISAAKTEAITSANDTLTTTIANYYTKSQTDSQINVAKEAINLGVSTTYETKENVETKVTSTLNSAKSYADTKKTEAISTAASDATSKANKAKTDAISTASSDATSKANTAKQEAIASANNTLNSTISNYYTKSQTDSQINVAKEAIDLSVSTNYETKQNVETKVTSTLNSAKSYADTKKSEAIDTAASDATSKANTAKQEAISSANNTLSSTIANYYTKTQTDSQINVAKQAIDLSVSTTYETKTTVQNKIDSIQVGGTNLWVISDLVTGWENSDGTIVGTGTQHKTRQTIIPTNGVRQIVYQCWNQNRVQNGENLNRVAFFDSNRNHISSHGVIQLNGDFYQQQIIDIPENAAYMRLGAICGPQSGEYDSTIKIKFELGNKPTDYSVAPEDVKKDISTAKSEAISTASSDATSKANKAKDDAIKSANSTLNTTIANYYTKTQTDSQINVAKEAIDLSVSTTYETKENVTSKINGIQIGGTNLWVISDLVTGWEDNNGTITGSGAQHKTRQTIIPTNGAKQLVYQCWNPNGVVNDTNTNRVAFFDSSETWMSSFAVVKLNGEAHQQQIFDIPENTAYVRLGAICGPSESYDETIKIKFELGNKPTDYSIAPEDIQSEFTVIESETRSIRETVTSLQLGTDSINASVKSLEESMTNTTNGLANDISRIQDQVNLKMTSDDVKLEIQKEMSKGANKVSTSTGFTFDQNGLNISKTDSEMKTQITEDGMKIYKNDDIMLTANNQGVDAKNLHATTYLIIGGNSRMEDFTEDGNKRTAVFWIG